MVAGFRSRWQQVKHHWIALGVGAIVLVAVITLIIVGYWFDWTGFNGYNKVTLAYTTSGTNASTVTSIEEYQPGKALWDWPPLLGILAIPVVVGWFTFQQGRASDAKRKQQHETDLKIAADQQKENALQAHLDSMSKSILEKTLLRKDTSILDLEGADCNGVFGGFIDLSTGSGAKILVFDSYDSGIEANLRGANLSEAILSSSNATMKKLAQAESLQGATMPDGAKHP